MNHRPSLDLACCLAAFSVFAFPALAAPSPHNSAAKKLPQKSIENLSKAVSTAPAIAIKIPRYLDIPTPTLLQELLAVQTLATMKFTPAQTHSAKLWVGRAVGPESEAGQMTTRMAKLLGLLQRERDLLAAKKPLPDSLVGDIAAEQAAQTVEQARVDRYLQDAAQEILPTLTATQKNILVAQQPSSSQVEAAHTLIQQAVLAGPADFTTMTKSVQANYPNGGEQIITVLNSARELKPLDMAKRINTLSLKVAELMAYTGAPAASTETDPILSGALTTLFQQPSVQETLLRMPGADSTGPETPGARTPGSEIAGEGANSPAALAQLQNAAASLQQQIHALILLTGVGFSTSQIDSATPWLEKVDAMRAGSDDSEHDIRGALNTAVQKVAHAALTGTAPTLDVDGNSPDFLNALEFLRRKARADLQMGALGMLNAMPAERVADFASGNPPTERCERILSILNNSRAYSLREYLGSENQFVRQLLPQASPEGDAKVKDILRQARLMTDAQYLSNVAAFAHTILVLSTPPAKPAPPAATPAKAGTGTADMDKEEQMQNQASVQLIPALDVPGLSQLFAQKGSR